jgi:hypothetical protein
MKTRLLIIALMVFPAAALAQQVRITPDMKKAMDALDTMTIRAHIEFLSDDVLRGRLPGTVGYKMAADYVVEDFTKLGLQPAGDLPWCLVLLESLLATTKGIRTRYMSAATCR